MSVLGERIWSDRGVERTPSVPKPGLSLISATSLVNSRCSAPCRSRWASVSVGRARIHFCMTVHTLGACLVGAAASIASCRLVYLLAPAPFVPFRISAPYPFIFSLTWVCPGKHGTVACHWANLLATAKYMSLLRRSWGCVTLPRTKRYIMPLLKRASSSGARPCCMSSSWFWVSRLRSMIRSVPWP